MQQQERCVNRRGTVNHHSIEPGRALDDVVERAAGSARMTEATPRVENGLLEMIDPDTWAVVFRCRPTLN